MLVTMATPISSHVKDKNSIFTARDEDMIFFVKGKILKFHQYLYNKLCSFTSLISQKFSDTAVILAIVVSKCCTQDLPVVNRQGSSTGFLFTYHSAIPKNFFKEYFFSGIIDFGVPFSINFLGIFRLPKSSGTRRYVLFG